MLSGDYDLAGGDKSGIMSIMAELLVIGMPLKSKRNILLFHTFESNYDEFV